MFTLKIVVRVLVSRNSQYQRSCPHLLVIDEDKTLLVYGECDYSGRYVTRYVMTILGGPKKDFRDASEKSLIPEVKGILAILRQYS